MKHNKLNKYNPRAPNKIDTKNVMLKYLKMIEDMLIEMFSSPTIIRKISNTSYKGYVCDKLRKELNSGDTRHAEAVLDSFKFKRQEKPQEIIAEKVKLMPQKKNRNRNQNLNSKQATNQASSIVSTNKRWK